MFILIILPRKRPFSNFGVFGWLNSGYKSFVCSWFVIFVNVFASTCRAAVIFNKKNVKGNFYFANYYYENAIVQKLVYYNFGHNPYMIPIHSQIGKLMHMHKANFVTPSPPVQCCKQGETTFGILPW
jgi:hypothetical protein